VGAPDGTSGNFQSRARIKSLQAAILPGVVATGTQKKRRRRRRKKKKKKKHIIRILGGLLQRGIRSGLGSHSQVHKPLGIKTANFLNIRRASGF
jgi:hypothetical protein